MYNFALAFVVCCIVYLIGEAVSNITKAWIPSVFVTAAVLIVGYWTIIPKTLITDSALIPFGSTTGIYLLLVHMGSIISLKQLAENWKTVVVCLIGLVGMCAFAFIFCPMLMDYNLIIAGLPPLTGGIVAATTMMNAAQEAGLQEAAVFAIVMYCMQGFAGYPLTAICLQLEGKAKLKEFRAGKMAAQAIEGSIDADSGKPGQGPHQGREEARPPAARQVEQQRDDLPQDGHPRLDRHPDRHHPVPGHRRHQRRCLGPAHRHLRHRYRPAR